MKREKFISFIPKIESIIGYTFHDKSLLIQAFTRTSYCNEHKAQGKPSLQSNEVLEFFGDSVLSLSIITYLLSERTERYEFGIRTELGEGDFSNIKSKLSDKKNLSTSTYALGLEKYLIMGEGDEKLGIATEPSVMEDLFESIIGAVYIDTGMDVALVMQTVSKILDMSVYKERGAVGQSAKNALQEWCADKKRRMPPPVYKTLSEDGPDHKKTYVRGVYIGDELIARADGKNFKIADAKCAELALSILESKGKCEPQSPKTKSAPQCKHAKPKMQADKLPDEEIIGSAIKLKDAVQRNKLSLPRFRDLGESRENGRTVYRVECILGEFSEIGSASDRRLAREAASALMLKKIEPKKAPKTSYKNTKKHTR